MDSARVDSAILDSAAHDGRALLAAARSDWTRRVPHCPDWDAAGLVGHMGRILVWIGAIVTSGQRQSGRSISAPEDHAELPDWYSQNLARTVAILREADPDTETWTFSTLADQRVSWWRLRLAVEIAIHRWDAEYAAEQTPSPLSNDVAGRGVGEFMTEFLPGLLSGAGKPDGVSGTVHLHAIDGDCEWWADLDSPGVVAAEHRRGDVAIRGTCSDLLLWLTNREPAQALSVLGDRTLLEQWRQLVR